MTNDEKTTLLIAGIIIIIMTLTAKQAIEIGNDIDAKYADFIQVASARFGVPASRIKAHIIVESRGNPNAMGTAMPIHERGLMQLKPEALADSNKISHDNYTFDDMWDAEKNINAGTAYLKWIEKYFFPGDWDKVSRAYNQGVGKPNNALAYAYLAQIKIAELV